MTASNPKNLTAIFFLASLLFSSGLSAQLYSPGDTLKIKEVIITRKQISSDQPGFKFYTVDSGRIASYSHFTLNDLLRDATPLLIKEYGAGLASTASFRGTSAGHTQVLWNGININDPMLGQTDFSLLPSGMIDNVMVSFGGASMDLGSGAIGGIINLGNEPAWKSETTLDVAPATGSFGRYNGTVRISSGTEKFQSVTRAFLNSARNNFRYFDSESSEPGWKNREFNKSVQEGFMQEFYIRKSKNVFSSRFWYQNADRDLPGSTLYGYSGEKQSDESFRSIVSYDGVNDRSEFFASAAWMNTAMHYTSFFDTAGSRNIVNTMVVRGGVNYSLNESMRLKAVFSDELNMVRTNYYSENQSRNNASLTLSAERKKGKWFGAAILIRETLVDRVLLIPDFSAGFEVRALRGEEHYLKLNFSRNSRIPTLNDRFWNPGGNPGLKNEYAYSIEAGYKLDQKITSCLKIASEVNYFNNYIRNMIQWYPKSEFVWIAGNVGSVNTSGIESSLTLKMSSGKLNLDLNAAWSYTRARDISGDGSPIADYQLAYIPKHHAATSLDVSFGSFHSSWITAFNSRVYISANNDSYLDDYSISSLSGGYRFKFGQNFADMSLMIDNIFGVSYNTIAYYPQPGRSYMLVLSLRLKYN